MKYIKHTFFALLLIAGTQLSAQTELPSNKEIEKSLEKAEIGMEFMLGFIDQFANGMIESLNIKGLEEIEIKESDKEIMRKSMKEGFEVLKKVDIDKLESLLREMEDQFKGLNFEETFKDSSPSKKKQATKI